MATSEIEKYDRHDLMFKLSQDWLKGNTNLMHLARSYGIKRTEVQEILDEWKDLVHNTSDLRDQAKDTLQETIQHYSEIKRRLWQAVEEADNDNKYQIKAQILKSIAEISAKEVDMLQKAGLYDDAALGDELADMEDKKQILVGILKDVSLKCPNCRMEVSRRLSKVTGTAEEIIVQTSE